MNEIIFSRGAMFRRGLSAAALALCAAQAQAMPVGNITISPAVGALADIDEVAGTVSFYCAIATCVEPNNSVVTYADGIFSDAIGQTATIYGFNYADPLSPEYLIGNTLWDAGGYTLIADSLESTTNAISFITGKGAATILQGGNPLGQAASWSLSIDRTGVVNYSSTADLQEVAVPEPNPMALLCLGLIGIAAARYRRAAARRA